MASEQPTREGNPRSPDIILDNAQTPEGIRSRQLMRWRVPGIGYVDMYINPQSLTINEQKVIQKQRTKGGYIIQYWGEDLPTIKMQGTTAASGVEGINILRQVYRAEQNAFQQVAQSLSDRINAFSAAGSLANVVAMGGNSAAGALAGELTVGAVTALTGSGSAAPLMPTLGSLAVSVELFYQSWVFKGYFTDFEVRETVTDGVGVFMYSLGFTVIDRRGFRANFMPWHRNPVSATATSDPKNNPSGYNRADTDTTPLNFSGESE